MLEQLIERSRLFHYPEVWLYLFSKSGFTKECQAVAAKSGRVRLISFEEM